MLGRYIGAGGAMGAAAAAPAQTPDFPSNEVVWPNEGWAGFTDFAFLATAVPALILAVVLALLLGYHPSRMRSADTVEQIQAPRIFTLYSVIGAIIGIMVLKYGLVVGFVVFGIGGLIRFRTELRSAMYTGQVIFVTLIGLSCGLNLPHVAVLGTAFGYLLILALEMRRSYRIEIKDLPAGRVAQGAAAYRMLLEQNGCRFLQEKKSEAKQRVAFIFHSPAALSRHEIEELFETKIDPGLRGVVDWGMD